MSHKKVAHCLMLVDFLCGPLNVYLKLLFMYFVRFQAIALIWKNPHCGTMNTQLGKSGRSWLQMASVSQMTFSLFLCLTVLSVRIIGVWFRQCLWKNHIIIPTQCFCDYLVFYCLILNYHRCLILPFKKRRRKCYQMQTFYTRIFTVLCYSRIACFSLITI